jgi:hypothetical protein
VKDWDLKIVAVAMRENHAGVEQVHAGLRGVIALSGLTVTFFSLWKPRVSFCPESAPVLLSGKKISDYRFKA